MIKIKNHDCHCINCVQKPAKEIAINGVKINLCNRCLIMLKKQITKALLIEHGFTK